MGKQENLEFLDKLYHLMNQLNADVVDYQGLKAQTIPPLCPNCQSKNIIKMAHNKDSNYTSAKTVVETSELPPALSSIG
ncbi:MAG: hypothetical protein IPH17_04900 [Bacteroidales bacterium]|nr:hypothetical protein [Bacteroidales bacterium]